MEMMTLLGLALGLAMDASAVSISNAMCYPQMKGRQRLATALTFGLFQGAMPIIGFFAGRLFYEVIQALDHWIALMLLALIGGKMLVEGIRALRKPESCPPEAVFTTRAMLLQGVATSIDALAVGISFAALSVNIWLAAGVIAAVTLLCCVLAGFLGRRFGALLGEWAQIFGGLLLVGIGIKIFVEHMVGLG